MRDRIEIIEGDLTTAPVDAIVNAADSQLQHGGGVAGAIVRRGGDVIQQESDRIGFVATGKAAVTSGGSLPARYVIHAVGPRMGEGDEDEKLRSATLSALEKAAELNVSSVAFPAISTGIFGYPLERCAPLMLEVASDFLSAHERPERVLFYLVDPRAAEIFRSQWEGLPA